MIKTVIAHVRPGRPVKGKDGLVWATWESTGRTTVRVSLA